MRPGLADLSLGGSGSLLLALVDVPDVGAAENPEVDSRSASLFLALAALYPTLLLSKYQRQTFQLESGPLGSSCLCMNCLHLRRGS